MDSTRTTPKWKGLTDGVTSEWTLFAKVKPGQEEAFREWAKTKVRDVEETQGYEDVVIGVGTVHDYRWVVFENGTRVLFTSNFDGDWGKYIDDFFATKLVEKSFDDALSFCEGYPGSSASHAVKKEWFQAHTQQAAYYKRAYRGTVKEIWKALKVQKAFESALDQPGAAEALKHPALKALLDEAAD